MKHFFKFLNNVFDGVLLLALLALVVLMTPLGWIGMLVFATIMGWIE